MVHSADSRVGDRAPLVWAAAVVLPLVAVWLELALSRATGSTAVFLVPSLATAVAAWYGGLWPGVLATAVSIAALDFLRLAPGSLGTIDRSSDGWALVLFTGGWLAVAVLLDRAERARAADRRGRASAERVAAHAERLAQLTSALGRARSASAVIEAAVQEPLHLMRGDAAMLCLVGDDPPGLLVSRAVGYEPGIESDTPLSLTIPGVMRDAVRRRTPVVMNSHAAQAAEYGSALEGIVPEGYEAAIAIPVVVGHRAAAVVRMDFRESRAFTADDHAFIEALSSHAGHALERAWQQASDQRARIEAEGLRERADQELARRREIEQALRASETRFKALASRTTRLHALTAALSEAVTTDAVAHAIVQQATVVVGATAGEVLMLNEAQADAADLPPSNRVRRFTPEPGFCETDVIAKRGPVFVRSWDESQEQYWRSASAAADAAYISSAALPLLVNASAAGVLRFDFSVPVNFDDEYQALLVSVAQHCSQALDRARLYETAQRARAEAEAASRLKDDFLSIVSHELRTPLNAVLGWASMLQKSALDPALAQRAVQSIHENATRQAKLIDDLLDVSRIAAGRATLDCQDVDVTAIVAGVVESLIPAAASGGVELQLAPSPAATVLGDRRRLEQVFFNLLGNALKFTPAGGSIRIDAEVGDRTVDIRIRDNGIGIAPEFLPHVFDRFRQADSTSTRTYGGLGLGLSIAKQLVDAHKGTIAVASEGKGQGTTFTVRLPVTEAAHLRGIRDLPARRGAADVPWLGGTRVLVVDDEKDARDVMAIALSSRGASVTAAATAGEAFELLTSQPFDVLLADIAMPGEDGCSLIRRVRSCGQGKVALIPAAAVTAHARDEERRSVLDAGFHMHLVKPIEPGDLVRAVSGLASGSADVALTTA